MNKIKVLHFEIDSNWGGIETFLLNLYRNIDRTKFQFDFVTRSDNPACASELKALGGNIYKISSYKHPIRCGRDIRNILRNGYDIVHIHKNSAANILPFIVVKRYSKATIISHSHNTRPSVNGPYEFLHKINKKMLYKMSNVHLACSKVAGEWLCGKNQDFEVVQNGIDCKSFRFDASIRDEYRKSLNISNDAFVVCHVGRFTKQKNHELLLKIFKYIHQQNPNSFLILVGDGPLKNDIVNQIDCMKLNEHVIILSNRSDVNKILMMADCFVMPSLYEGLPFVAIEAEASGLKLYASKKISKEIDVLNNVDWFDLDIDVKSLASKIIITGCNSPKQRLDENDQMNQSEYSISHTSDRIEKIYLSCVRNQEQA